MDHKEALKQASKIMTKLERLERAKANVIAKVEQRYRNRVKEEIKCADSAVIALLPEKVQGLTSEWKRGSGLTPEVAEDPLKEPMASYSY